MGKKEMARAFDFYSYFDLNINVQFARGLALVRVYTYKMLVTLTLTKTFCGILLESSSLSLSFRAFTMTTVRRSAVGR